MADVFQDELRKLLEQTSNPGPMYQNWENPTNRPDQKAPAGVYATPWDRQGGPAVAQAELEQQARGILARFVENPSTVDEAVRAMFDVLQGKNQSPADKGGGAPALEINKQFQYGGSDAQYSALARKGFSRDDIVKYQAMRAAEDEEERQRREEEERKRREEEAKTKEEGEKKEREEKELAARLAPVVEAMVQSRVNQALSAYGISQNAAQAAPTPPQSAQAAIQSGTQAGAWRDLPGVNVPPGMQMGATQPQYPSAMSANEQASPYQQRADGFLRIASAKLSALTDPYQKGRAKEQLNQLYSGILSGQPVHIDDPLLQSWANEAGVQYYDMSGGLGQSI